MPVLNYKIQYGYMIKREIHFQCDNKQEQKEIIKDLYRKYKNKGYHITTQKIDDDITKVIIENYRYYFVEIVKQLPEYIVNTFFE